MTLTIVTKRAGAKDHGLAAGCVAVLVGGTALALWFVDRTVEPKAAFIPMGGAAISLTLLVYAYLFASHFVLTRDRVLLLGFGGALTSAFLMAAQTVLHAGVITEDQADLYWIGVSRRALVGLVFLAYAILRLRPPQAVRAGRTSRILLAVIMASAGLAGGLVWGILAEPRILPVLFAQQQQSALLRHWLAPLILALYCLAAILMLARVRRLSVLDLWVTVSIVAGVVMYIETRVILGPGVSANLFTQINQVQGFILWTLTTVMVLSEVVGLHHGSLELNEKLSRLVAADGLTGLANRRAFDERLRMECRSAEREGRELTLLMVDIDHFKRFNDCYGHVAGDHCIQAVAGAFKSVVLRPTDLVARYGGEEFSIILPGSGLSGAQEVAARVLLAVRALEIPHKAGTERGIVTVSIGAAAFQAGETERSFVERADLALYAAKREGRDRLELAREVVEATPTAPVWVSAKN